MTYAKVLPGDCTSLLKRFPDDSVDAIVTDPPYGLEFMGKEWDKLKGDIRQPGDSFYKSGAGPFDRTTVRYGYNVDSNACRWRGSRPVHRIWHHRGRSYRRGVLVHWYRDEPGLRNHREDQDRERDG